MLHTGHSELGGIYKLFGTWGNSGDEHNAYLRRPITGAVGITTCVSLLLYWDSTDVKWYLASEMKAASTKIFASYDATANANCLTPDSCATGKWMVSTVVAADFEITCDGIPP